MRLVCPECSTTLSAPNVTEDDALECANCGATFYPPPAHRPPQSKKKRQESATGSTAKKLFVTASVSLLLLAVIIWAISGNQKAREAGTSGEVQRVQVAAAKPGDSSAPPAGNPTQEPQHDYEGWEPYAPHDGRFRIQFPGEPVLHPQTTSFREVSFQSFAGSGLNLTCKWKFAMWDSLTAGAADAYLTGQHSGTPRLLGGKAVEEAAISWGNYPGRMSIVQSQKGFVHFRSFVAGNRIIFLFVGGDDLESVKSGNAVKFFDSLKIRE